jgi:hypothetical protein
MGPAFALAGTNIIALEVFVCGIGVFTLAMWYDGRDPARITRRSDVAFWLHLLAAPMLVHPLFTGSGLVANAGRPEAAAAVVVAFAVLTLVSRLPPGLRTRLPNIAPASAGSGRSL